MWGLDDWGEMIWGGGAGVPTMDFWSLFLMAACFLAGGYFLSPQHRTRRSYLVFAVLVAIPMSVSAVLPNYFTNGTIADADEVNGNFIALDDQLIELKTGTHQRDVGCAGVSIARSSGSRSRSHRPGIAGWEPRQNEGGRTQRRPPS